MFCHENVAVILFCSFLSVHNFSEWPSFSLDNDKYHDEASRSFTIRNWWHCPAFYWIMELLRVIFLYLTLSRIPDFSQIQNIFQSQIGNGQPFLSWNRAFIQSIYVNEIVESITLTLSLLSTTLIVVVTFYSLAVNRVYSWKVDSQKGKKVMFAFYLFTQCEKAFDL